MMDNQWDDNLIIDAYERSMKLVNKKVDHLMKDDKIEKSNQKATNRTTKSANGSQANGRCQLKNANKSTSETKSTDVTKSTGVTKSTSETKSIDEMKSPDETKSTSVDQCISKWKVGDYCQAQYTEDDSWYEAEIILIDEGLCTIRYIGYLNEEVQDLNELRPSAGEEQRINQEKQCLEESLDRLSMTNQDDMEIQLNEPSISNLQNVVQSDSSTYQSVNSQTNLKYVKSSDKISQSSTPDDQSTRPQVNSTSRLNPTVLMPPLPTSLPESSIPDENELLSTTLMSWYMSGYHTGYYQAIKDLKKSNN